MFPTTITTVCGPVTLSQKAVEYIAHELPRQNLDTVRGAFSALGLDEEARYWAKSANSVVGLRRMSKKLRKRSKEAEDLRIQIEAAEAHAALAWNSLQGIIDKCRELLPASTLKALADVDSTRH